MQQVEIELVVVLENLSPDQTLLFVGKGLELVFQIRAFKIVLDHL